MTNKELFQYCLDENGRPISVRMRWHNIKCHKEIYEYLINYFDDADDTNSSSTEILYRIMNNISVKPVCPVCGKPSEFKRFDRGYGLFCSNKCRRSKEGEQIVREKTNNTFIEKYGYKCASQNVEIKEKLKATCQERYGGNSPSSSKEIMEKQLETKRLIYGEHMEKITEKTRATNLERYGVEYISQNLEIMQKMINTYKKRYGALFNPEKTKETCLEKYGVEKYSLSEDIKIKRKNALIEHYNVDVPLKNKDILEKQKKSMIEKYGYDHNFKDPKLIEKLKSSEIREQQWETKKKNGTTNTSKIEEQFAKYLEDNNYTFERNYAKDKRYPYHVDFYLNDFDLFIEIQGTWTHGGHPFNALNEDDQKRLLEMKSKNTKYYESAIRSWTIRDVEKRECAKRNNLNYLEMFSCDLDECINLFKQKVNNIIIS